MCPIFSHTILTYLGKLKYFTNLNLAAIWGSIPLLTMIPVRENSEVVIIYPDYMKKIKFIKSMNMEVS